jgi:hypothetical protein
MGLDLLIVMDMVVCMCLVCEKVRESKIEFSFGGLICLVCEKVRESKRFFSFFFLFFWWFVYVCLVRKCKKIKVWKNELLVLIFWECFHFGPYIL